MNNKLGPKPITKRPCAIMTCSNERFDLVHKFPMEDDRTKKWLNAINSEHLWNVPLDKLKNSYFVCSRHFRNEDYKNPISRSINKTAVPSLNLKNLNDLHLVIHRSQPRPTQFVYTPSLINQPSTINQLSSTNKISKIPPTENIVTEEVKCLLNCKHKIAPINKKKLKLIKKFKRYDFEKETNKYQITRELLKSTKKSINNVVMERLKPDEMEDKEEIDQVSVTTQLEIYDENGCLLEQIKNGCDKNSENVLTTTNDDMPTSLEISHPEYPEITNLNYFWLRDHCKCNICYNSDTHQRNYNLLDISLDVKPSYYVDGKNDKLYVKWDDGHESEYNYKFLFQNSKENLILKSEEIIEKFLWNKQNFLDDQIKYAKIDFGNFLKDDDLAKDVVKSLLKYGLAFIENVPPTTDMTEMTIRRLFPIQKTFFGEMWTFSDKKQEHSDFAYTNKFLLSHNDNTYFNDPAGLITFHCIKHNGDGGETILVDGFNAINELKLKNPKAYEILCNINVPSEYIEDGQYHKYVAPIIKLNLITKQPEQIRYNLYDRSIINTISQNDIDNFYKSLRELTYIIQSPQNEFRFKLKPGTVVIFDNWRLLHGREKYNGLRIVTGCYVQRTDFLSKARVFGLLS